MITLKIAINISVINRSTKVSPCSSDDVITLIGSNPGTYLRITEYGRFIGIGQSTSVYTSTTLTQASLWQLSSRAIGLAGFTSIVSIPYAPRFSSSTIIVEYNTRYTVAGYFTDSDNSRLTVAGVVIANGYQQWINGAVGGGCRSGTLFPLAGAYANSALSSVIVAAQAGWAVSDDVVTYYGDPSTSLRITEISSSVSGNAGTGAVNIVPVVYASLNVVTAAISSSVYATVASYTYTPIYSSSAIYLNFYCSYSVTGGGSDVFQSQMTVAGTAVARGSQAWALNSAQFGVGTRSGILFPLLGAYTSSSTSPVLILLQVSRVSGTNSFSMLATSVSAFLKIIERSN